MIVPFTDFGLHGPYAGQMKAVLHQMVTSTSIIVPASAERAIVEADGRWYVRPGNGLFELVQCRAGEIHSWRIDWKPEDLSSSFHGRDLFAPVAAMLARGEPPPAGHARSQMTTGRWNSRNRITKEIREQILYPAVGSSMRY
jgi:S-adenosylmethionine hydrolase